jgi:hypothetical protein
MPRHLANLKLIGREYFVLAQCEVRFAWMESKQFQSACCEGVTVKIALNMPGRKSAMSGENYRSVGIGYFVQT